MSPAGCPIHTNNQLSTDFTHFCPAQYSDILNDRYQSNSVIESKDREYNILLTAQPHLPACAIGIQAIN